MCYCVRRVIKGDERFDVFHDLYFIGSEIDKEFSYIHNFIYN